MKNYSSQLKKMNHKTTQLICLSIIFFGMFGSAKSSRAATYYIDSVNGLDTRTSTQAQSVSTPWKHCPGQSGAAANAASYSTQSDDVFVFKGGVTWTLNGTDAEMLTIPASGEAGRPITYVSGDRCGKAGSVSCNGGVAWGTGRAILDATATVNGRTVIYSLYKSNIVIDGLEIRNAAGSDGTGLGIGIFCGSNFEVKNSYIHDDGVNGIAVGDCDTNIGNFLIHDNVIERVSRIHVSGGANATIDGFKFYNNLFRGPGDIASGGYHGDGVMIGGDRTSPNWGVTNAEIYNNRFYGNWSQGATAQIYLNSNVQHMKIYNNVFTFDNIHKDSGLSFIMNAFILSTQRADDVMIYNNTMDSSGLTGSNGLQWCIAAHGNQSNLDIQNNICLNATSAIGLIDDYWTASTPWTKGKSIVPTTWNGYSYENTDHTGAYTTGVSEPNWASIQEYYTLTDNRIVWRKWPKSGTPPAWQANTVYALRSPWTSSDSVCPTSGCPTNGCGCDGSGQNCNSPCMFTVYQQYDFTGTTEPHWAADCPNVGDTCTDNQVIWSKKDKIAKTIDHNLYYGWTGHLGMTQVQYLNDLAAWQSPPYSYDAHSVVGDPKFTSAPNGRDGSGNQHILSGSSAISNGANFSSIFTTDLDNKPRQSSPTAWDMGAYEYVPGGDTTPPAAPTGLTVQ